MKAVLVLSLTIFCGLIYQQVKGDDFDDKKEELLDKLALLIALIIKAYANHFKEITIAKKADLNFKSNLIVGSLNYSDLILYGLDGLTLNRVDDKTDLFKLQYDDTKKMFTISSNISIPSEVGIRLKKYSMDVGLNDTIPLFGTGDLNIHVQSVNTGIYMNISFSNGTKVDYLEIRPDMSFMEFNVTGFWNIPNFNAVPSALMTWLLNIFVVFWELEIDLITCLISRFLEDVLNRNKNIIDDLKQKCSSNAANSSYPIVKTLFDGDKLDIMEYATEENILKCVSIVSDYLEKEINLMVA